MSKVSAPSSAAGKGWLAVAAFAAFVGLSSGGEFAAGFGSGYCSAERAHLRPGCAEGPSWGQHFTTGADGQPATATNEVAAG
jgi:hypothetical protein